MLTATALFTRMAIASAVVVSAMAADGDAPRWEYVMAVSEATAGDDGWRRVLAALAEKYPDAREIRYPAGDPRALREELAAHRPARVCYVAPPEEVTRAFVTSVHQLLRGLDDDPYTDALWGILTGHHAANALEIARTRAPLEIGRVAAGTEVELDRCREGRWYCELTPGRRVEKPAGGEAVESKGPQDTTEALVGSLNDYKAQLFITSGHATERDWQIGFHVDGAGRPGCGGAPFRPGRGGVLRRSGLGGPHGSRSVRLPAAAGRERRRFHADDHARQRRPGV